MDPGMVRATLLGFVGVLLAASLMCWWLAFGKFRDGQPLVEWTERRPVPWGLLDVIACFVLLVIFDGAALQMAGLTIDTKLADLPEADQTRALVAMTIGRVSVALLGLFILTVRAHAKPHDTGVGVARVGADIGLGAMAFLMVAPGIYLLQTLLSQLFPDANHPLVDVVRESPNLPLFGAAFATAVIAAPLTEEFLLRGLFQGWMEKIAVWHGPSSALLVGGTTEWQPSTDWSGAKAPPVSIKDHPPAWPIFVSALLFAAMHIQEDQMTADPIPLFLFALALGFLYQRTHRLLPCIVMHMLLNTSSMLILGLSIWKPELVPFETP